MQRRALLVASVAVAAAACSGLAVRHFSTPPPAEANVITAANEAHFQLREQEAAGLCPWRNRDKDLAMYYPGPSEITETNLVLSSRRVEVAKKLGRQPTGDESGLRIFRISRSGKCIGVVAPRRVRGDNGLIELVLMIDIDTGAVRHAEVQRLREPEASASALTNVAWLQKFEGLTADSDWNHLAQASGIPAAARGNATAITQAARTALVLFSQARSIRNALPSL